MADPVTPVLVSEESLHALVEVLDVIRSGRAKTRSELGAITNLGRTVVTQRVAQLLESGLVIEDRLAASTGGRPARALRFRAEAGSIIAVELGATSIAVGITDLAGSLIDWTEEPANVADGPDTILGRVEELVDEMLATHRRKIGPVWGVGIGLPGPVEYAVGRPISPPIMPGWDGYPVRDRFSDRYHVPTWVDNDVNLMVIGEFRAGRAKDDSDVVFIKIGTGIGAGLISRRLPHRGAQGVAGDVGHVAVIEDPTIVCRCGKIGCLEAVAGGAALARIANQAAADGSSPFLAARLETKPLLDASDLGAAALHGDPFAVDTFGRTGSYIGRMLATLINFYNPSLVIIGGGVAEVGDLLLASIRQSVYSRSLPLATRDLRIIRSSRSDQMGMLGAAFVVLDELFAPNRLSRWIAAGSPAGLPDLVAA